MTAREALHTAARRYCVEQDRHLRDQCLAHGHSLLPPALQARAAVLDAILWEVEQVAPNQFEALETLREYLLLAGQVAGDTVYTVGVDDEGASQAIAAQRAQFCGYLLALSVEDLKTVGPMPYRRGLRPEESERLWRRLEERWGTEEGYWYPLIGHELPPDVLAFQGSCFHGEVPLGALRAILTARGIARVWELRQGGHLRPHPRLRPRVRTHELEYSPLREYELATPLLDLTLNLKGDEGYWTAGEVDWLVYYSHEDSITFGGEWLIQELKQVWPDWKRGLIAGPEWHYGREAGAPSGREGCPPSVRRR